MENSNYFIHESSYADKGCEIGYGTKIWHFSHIQSGAKIGKACNIGQNVNIADGAIVGDNVKIQNNVSVYGGVTLSDNVFCGPSIVFTNDLNPRCEFPKNGKYFNTFVDIGATIGANATILCGINIGKYALIGCGAVVVRDVVPHAIMVGNPARRIGSACRCGATLKLKGERFYCDSCGRSYINASGIPGEEDERKDT